MSSHNYIVKLMSIFLSRYRLEQEMLFIRLSGDGHVWSPGLLHLHASSPVVSGHAVCWSWEYFDHRNVCPQSVPAHVFVCSGGITTRCWLVAGQKIVLDITPEGPILSSSFLKKARIIENPKCKAT